mgnify:CR=1 FL=1
MRSNAPDGSFAWISAEQAMAPALTIGLNGRLSGPRRIELKESPDGSTPIVSATDAWPQNSIAIP